MSTINNEASINKYNPFIHYPEAHRAEQSAKIEVRERSWCAITLDGIGAIPLLGSLAGVVRIVISVALRAFYRYSMRNEENRETRLLIAQTESEIHRGLIELFPGYVWYFENKQAENEEQGKLGIENVARGNYFYVDPELGLHYVAQMYPDTDYILWQNKMPPTTINKPPEGLSQGIHGRVFNPEMHQLYTTGSGLTHIRDKTSASIQPLSPLNNWLADKVIGKWG